MFAMFRRSDTAVRSNPSASRLPFIAVEDLERRALFAASITGSVVRDLTGNGLTSDDKPLAGVVVKLFKDVNANGKLDSADGSAVASKTSASNGTFSFTGLSAGKYLLQDAAPTNQVRTAPLMTSTIAVDAAKKNGKYEGFKFANYVKDFDRSAVSNISYTITGAAGTKTVTNLLGNVRQGDAVTANFTVASGKSVTLSLVSYTAPTSFGENLQFQKVFQSKTGTFSAGRHSLSIKVPSCYFQVDFVGGPVIDQFGPAGSNVRYSIQGRLISFDNGGSTTCGNISPQPGPGPTPGPSPVETLGSEGLTPGFWKNHTNTWGPTGLSPSQTLESIFDVPDSLGMDNVTLLQALGTGGGGAKALFRHAVAAALNARHPDVDYALSYSDIVSRVNSALAGNSAGTIESLKDLLDRHNNAGGGIDAHGRAK